MRRHRKAERIRLSKLDLAAALLVLSAMCCGAPQASAASASFCRGSTEAAIAGAPLGKQIQGVSLALERNRLHAGEALRARLVNRGQDLGSYGEGHRVERYSGSEWVVDPAGPHGPWTRKLWGLAPDRVGRCFEWVVPADLPAGTYRFVVPAKVNGTRSARVIDFSVS